MSCDHDPAEKETAIADGYCPLCSSEHVQDLKSDNERLRAALQMMVDHMFGPCASDMSRVEIEVLARSALKPLT